MRRQHTRPRRLADRGELAWAPGESGHRILGRVRDEDFFARREESVETFPIITQDRRSAGRGFEEASGWTKAVVSHVRPRDVERQS